MKGNKYRVDPDRDREMRPSFGKFSAFVTEFRISLVPGIVPESRVSQIWVPIPSKNLN